MRTTLLRTAPARVLAILLARFAALASTAADAPNLVANGGFEDGAAGWMYHQWAGKSLPGFVDREDRAEGAAALKMTTPGEAASRYLAREIAVPDPSRDHVLTLALKTRDVPPGKARVRLGIDGAGWFGTESGKPDLLAVGGTQDWKTYGFAVPAAKLRGAKKVTLFVYHDQPDQGVLGIDAVSFRVGAAAELPAGAGAAVLQGETSKPVLNTFVPGEPVELRFTASGLAPAERLALKLDVVDEHDQPITARELQVVGDDAGRWKGSWTAPGGRLGFYRVRAGLSNGILLAPSGSRPAGFLTYAVVPDPQQREDFGEGASRFGMQGGFGPWRDEVLALLGARWILDGSLEWKKREPKEAGQFKADSVDASRGASTWATYSLPTLFMAPSWAVVPGTFAYNTGTLTPAGETAWVAYCREAATAYARQNPDRETRYYQLTWEPIQPWGFKGRDEDLVRIYELAYDAIHAADPKASVAGPCRGVDKNEVARTTALLKLGLGRWLDAYSVHPYFTYEPEREGMAERLRTMRAALREHVGRDIPMLGTEQGLSTQEDPAKDLEHARALARQNLITLGEGFRFNMAFYVVDYRLAGQKGYGYYYNLVDGIPWAPAKASPRPIAPAFAAQSLLLDGHDAAGAVEGLGASACGYVFQRGDRVVLALWDYGGGGPKPVSLPVGRPEATVHDWMGNLAIVKSPGGMLELALGPEPVYVVGVSPALWGRDAANPLTLQETALRLADGDRASLAAVVTAPRDRAVEGVLALEADERLGIVRTERPAQVAAGASAKLAFPVAVDAALPAGRYALRLLLTEKGLVSGHAGATLDVGPPVVLDALAPGGPVTLAATLRNDGALPHKGTLRVRLRRVLKGEERPDLPMIDLPEGPARLAEVPGGTATVGFELAAKDRATLPLAFGDAAPNPFAAHVAEYTITTDGGRDASGTIPASFAVLRRASRPLQADGDLTDWEGVSAVPVRGPDAVIRAPKSHAGDADLAADVRLAWTEEALWLAVDVTDDVVCQEDTDTMIWRGDCVQLAVDVASGTAAGTRGSETTFALTPKGVEAYRHLSFDPGKLPMGPLDTSNVRAAVRRTPAGLVYEVAYPWVSLGLEAPPAPGALVAMALCVNDRDGSQQTEPSALGVFGGIYPAKDPARFGLLRLTE